MMTSERSDDASSNLRRESVAHAGQAGVLATLVMLAVQLIWRLNWSENGVVQAFPEFIVAAVSRLTPLSVFGAATENYGSLAKKTLFAAVLIMIIAVGSRSGQIAGLLAKKIERGGFGRLIGGLTVAASLLLFTLAVVMPVAHLGFFAADSSYQSDILLQLTTTFALFGLLWAVFATPKEVEHFGQEREGGTVSRRSLLGSAGWGLGTAAAAFVVGVSAWRLVTPRKTRVSAASKGNNVNSIVATQRAEQGNPLPTTLPTETPDTVSAVEPVEIAELRSDIVLQDETDPLALFVQLDAEGMISPVLTETDDFYHVSKNLIDPTVSADGWKLKITGMVNTPLELTYDEVVNMASLQKITTLSCISNTLNGDLAGTAQWTGLPLKEVLDKAGIKDGAIDAIFKGADDYEDSIPLKWAIDPDTTLVVGMNGEPLRDDHGYPARMIVPGIYGMKNVKWLQEIEIVGEDFLGYWQTRGWSDTAENQIWGRIDEPGGSIESGPAIATGLASAGDRDISRVEVSLDDGESWADATLEPSLNPPFTWVRWAFPFEATPGKVKMKMRATDGTGAVMDEKERSPLPDGATGWPRRSFTVKE